MNDLSLVEAADAIARGEVTSVQLTQTALSRARELGSKLNCIARLDTDDALRAAEQADRERKQGTTRGALHGVPLAHKDLFYRKGKVVACGSKIRRDFVPDLTASVLQRLDAAGAIDIGSLHMAEFAFSPSGYNEHYGHCRNPWNTAHVPGGSSSGSGAAVAARIIFASLGTDTGGSLRHPAAMCGVTGLKPTVTRVSRAGVMPLSHSLDCVGPIARTARDCARLMEVIAGADPADASASAQPVPRYEAALDGKARELRIGVPRTYYYEAVAPEIKARLDESLAVFRTLGARVTEVQVPDIDLINTLMHVLMAVEAATIHRKWLATRRNDYADQVRSRIEPGLFYPGTRYLEALSMRASITKEFVETAMNGVDVLHLPAIPVPVPTIEETTRGAPADVARIIGVLGHATRGINYLGLPSICVPAGFDPKGLPVGFQLVGRPFTEAALLRAADAYQRVTDWHKRKPLLT
ncbi:MAG TPA: amidase [Burkholderiales bacterium]|nr:amidase [Burkholderiales bacterium]